MFNGFYPRYDLEARIQHSKIDSWGYDIPSARMNRVEEPWKQMLLEKMC